VKIKVGDKVNICSKGHWADGEWGIVRLICGDEYHVGIAGDESCMVFAKSELKRAAK
jgi:hypothetical protein